MLKLLLNFIIRFIAIFFIFFCLHSKTLCAQYNLGANNGQTIIDCEGTLEDSGKGGNNPGDYGLNNDQTMTVCMPDAEEICIFIDEFNTEEPHDSLTIYTGTDLTGDVLLTLTGIQNASTICFPGEANGGIECFTFHFYSDSAVTRPGFNLHWEATIKQPPPIPPFNITGVDCEEASIVITLPAPILCQYVNAASFNLIGPAAPCIADAIADNCVDGLTTQITLVLCGPITKSGSYGLTFAYTYLDICGKEWPFNAAANFTVNNCPIEASLPPYIYTCGTCVFLDPDVTGGDGNYTYQWAPALEEGATVAQGMACPPKSATYTVTVTDGLGQWDTASVFVEVCPFEVTLPDASFCAGNCLDITALVTGGYAPFTYSWQAADPNAVSNVFINAATNTICVLSPTTITVTVTDAAGNITTATATMTVEKLTASLTGGGGTYCGTPLPIGVVANCGSGNYTYNWSPALIEGSTVASGNIGNLSTPQTYSVTVTDAETNEQVVISGIFVDLCKLQIDIACPSQLCNDTQSIGVNVSGLSGNYSYNWSPALNEGANVQWGTTSVTTATLYSVTVTDNITGEIATDTCTVDVCKLTANLLIPTYLCDELDVATHCLSINLDITGGSPPYNVVWSAPLDTLVGQGPHIVCLTDTTILVNVTITDSKGVTTTDIGKLDPCAFVAFFDGETNLCQNLCTDLTIETFGGTWAYEFTWLPPYDNLVGPGPHQICVTGPTNVQCLVKSGNEIKLVTANIEICPFIADVEIDTVMCPGQSDTLRLYITGGTGPYKIDWDVNGLGNLYNIDEANGIDPNDGYDPKYLVIAPNVASLQTDRFVVFVTDALGLVRTDTVWVNYHPEPVLPLQLFEICEGEPPQNLLPNAGSWSGQGVDDDAKLFYPDWNGPGTFTLTYFIDSCEASTQVIVHPKPQLAGDVSACIGGAPFQLQNPPQAGAWEVLPGTLTASGMFTPKTAGSYTCTYTTVNGCQSSITVLVQDITLSASASLVCASPVSINAIPANGWWDAYTGLDTNTGIFDPLQAGKGTHTLTYNLAGNCKESITITVADFSVTDYIEVCPDDQPTFYLSGTNLPPGGLWTSNAVPSGIMNPNTGLFNSNAQGGNNFTEVVSFQFDGCSDETTVNITKAAVTQSEVFICQNELPLLITSLGQPAGGVWSGSGIITDANGDVFFDPAAVPAATHTLTYSYNNCAAQVLITVYPIEANTSIIKCGDDAQFLLPEIVQPNPPGGTWNGSGVVPGAEGIGIFNPAIANNINQIIYTSPNGCKDTLTVTVNQKVDAQINSFGTYLCYYDTTLLLTAEPPGGNFTVNGHPATSFNPVDYGEGPVLIIYQYDNGCKNYDYYNLNVGTPIALDISPDTLICKGSSVAIKAFASGGTGNQYIYVWDNGLNYGQIKKVSPETTTTYTVTANDGCSNPESKNVTITVADTVLFNLVTNEPVCFGKDGFANIIPPTGANYSIEWNDNVFSGFDVAGTAGTYYATITDLNSGCKEQVAIVIPQYDPLLASFSSNENQLDCVKGLDLFFTDFSTGGVSGWWDFGDGTPQQPYVSDEVAQHSYASPGIYKVTLYIENEGNCIDQIVKEICIDLNNEILAPTAFSPNNDGTNDTYNIMAYGTEYVRLMIFSRWGEKVFETTDPVNIGWDGNYNGQPCEVGAFTYVIDYKLNFGPPYKRLGQLRGQILLVR